jgi:hypothetical protein
VDSLENAQSGSSSTSGRGLDPASEAAVTSGSGVENGLTLRFQQGLLSSP